MKRLFFALWPDQPTRQVVQAIAKQLQCTGFKLHKTSNLHVTLVFLGNVDDTSECLLRQQLDAITARPFSIQFDRLSYWRKPGIVCLTSEQALELALLELVRDLEAIAKNCGLNTDTRPYQPHITLARKARFRPELEFEPVNWSADAFSLVESVSTVNGVEYRVLDTWPFNEAS